LAQLRDTPKGPALLGGLWGAHLTGLQSVEPGQSATFGLLGVAELRDRLVLRAGVHQPLGNRGQAESYGASVWLSSESTLSVRLRVGRGRNTVSMEIGGGAAAKSGMYFDVDRDEVLSSATDWAPVGVGRLAYGGAALRLLRYEGALGAEYFLALDLDLPGVIGMF
jgi:hypothetical protein